MTIQLTPEDEELTSAPLDYSHEEAIDRIVTSQHAPPAMIWDLSQLGIQIIQA